MKDNELRSLVLQKYYEHRDLGFFNWAELTEKEMPPVKDFSELARICEQLAQHDLIEWKPIHYLGSRNPVAGNGKITAFGVDVIEGTARSPIAITFDHSQKISVQDSQNVQVGNHNSISSAINIDKIKAAIDHSTFSESEKAQAKSVLSTFLEHPLIAAIVGGLASKT